jgi:hypothetical protein
MFIYVYMFRIQVHRGRGGGYENLLYLKGGGHEKIF